jgi:glycosyltransferase involved in cell wall biosynthesis/predicted ATP-grasp superfamily ATP-dependent carboligase
MNDRRAVLITCAAQNAALASARSLHRAGFHVTLADHEPRAKSFFSTACDEKLVLADAPGEQPERFAAAILEMLRRCRIDVLLPVTDAAIFALLPYRADLEKLTTVVWASPEALVAAADKEATMRRASEFGLPAPRTTYLQADDPTPPELRFPVVVKPRRSIVQGRKYPVAYADDEAALRAVLRGWPAGALPALVQERIVGPGQGYFAVWRHGEPVVEYAHRRLRETPPSGGVSTLREAIALPDDLRDYARRLLSAWRWHGPVMVEFKRGADGRPYLMEVNGRLWGSLQLAIDAGVDIPLAAVLVALGEPVPPMQARPGVRTRWEIGDLDATLVRLLKRDAALDLPPGAPSRARWLADFLLDFVRPGVRQEVWRWRDRGPFLADVRQWLVKWNLGRRVLTHRRGALAVAHVHSTLSHDGEMTIADLASLLRREGVKICCLTEHAPDLDEAAVARMIAECARVSDDRFLMAPGLEFEFGPDCHLLGVTTLLPEPDPIALCRAIHAAGGVAVLAHPRPGWLRERPELARELDGFEVWNTSHHGTYLPSATLLGELRALNRAGANLRAMHGVDLHRSINLKRARLFLRVAHFDWPAVRRALLDRAYSFGHAAVRVTPGGVGVVGRAIYHAGRGVIGLFRPLWKRLQAIGRVPCWEFVECDCADCPARRTPDGGLICWRTVGTFSRSDLRRRGRDCDCTQCDYYRYRTGQGARRLRVMHLIETGNPGGAEQMMLSLIRGLDPARHTSQVVLLKPGWLEQKTREQGVSVIILPLARRFDWRFVLTLSRLVRRRGIDVLHSHEFAMNVYSSLVGLLTRRATVATVHGNLSYLQAHFRRRQAYRLIARLAGPMVVVSEEMKGQIAQRFDIAPAHLAVIPNGVAAPAQLPAPDEIRAARQKLNLPADAFLLAVIGSLYPVKGQMTLIEAMPALVAANPRAHLAVIGRGEMRAALEQRVAALGLTEHVTFTGYLDNVREHLAIFDLIVVPSRYEGLSLLVLEAMAVARPVIATHVGGNPEAIIDGESGLLVPPDDPPALGAACLRVMQDADFAARLGAAAQQRVRERFTLQHMVTAYEELYRRQVERRR